MSIEIKKSSWEAEWPKLPSLLRRHGLELGEHDIVLDLVSIAELDRKGALDITVAHDNAGEGEADELVAYLIWFLGPDLSRLGSGLAQMGPFYVLPEYRKSGLGSELFERSLAGLRKRNISRALPHAYTKSPAGLGELFERLGGVPYEKTWMIDLRQRSGSGVI